MDLVETRQGLNHLAKKKSGAAVKHCRIYLRSIMAEAIEQDFTRKNQARLLHVPKLKAVRKHFLTEPETKQLLKNNDALVSTGTCDLEPAARDGPATKRTVRTSLEVLF
jgi:hypothetical protein